jgi:hypothetical protein
MTEQHDDDHAPRRRLLKKLAAGGSAAGLAALPGKWGKPVVASVILPAHAQTSPQCLATIDNCPPGDSFSTVTELNSKYFDYKYLTNEFPGISFSDGTLSGSGRYSTSENVGPCPPPCDNLSGRKYYNASVSFNDGTATSSFVTGLRCGGDAVFRVQASFVGTYSGQSGNELYYTGSGSALFEGCKYGAGEEPLPPVEGQSLMNRQRLRRFRFGGQRRR